MSGVPVILAGPNDQAPTVGAPQASVLGIGEPALTVRGFSYYLNPSNNAVSIMLGDTAGQFVVSAPSATSPGLSQHSRMSSADINAQVVKASKGKVYGFQIFNTTASAKYVRLYNKATAPSGADTPVRRIMVPANGVASYHVGQGADGFTNGIAYTATGAAADADATALAAGDLLINIDYA